MGRRKLKPEFARTVRFQLSLTRDEYAALIREADRTGRPAAEVLRAAWQATRQAPASSSEPAPAQAD